MNGVDLLPSTAFALFCLAILVLPFIPAFREWRRPTDDAALPVLPNYTSDIDHFARRLQSDAAARLGLGNTTGYEDFDVVDPAAGVDWSQASRRMISGAIATDAPVRSGQQVYVQGSARAGSGSEFPSLYATGDIDLGDGSALRDWGHAEGVLKLGSGSIALRRVSAGTAIELGNDSWFERMHAPSMYFGGRGAVSGGSTGTGEPTGTGMQTQVAGDFAELPGVVRQTPQLYLVRGDCALPAGTIYRGSLIVTGFLTIGAGTTVLGDIKARDGLSLDRRAVVKGAVTCEKRIYLFDEAAVDGPVISESDLLIGARSVVGLPGTHTTVTACNIIVETGVVIHGTIWAHEIGMVKPA